MVRPTIVLKHLRYYAPAFDAENDATVRLLLDSIRANWRIYYEIVEIPTRPGSFAGTLLTDEKHEAELYDHDFAPRAGLIKFRTGTPINKSLRSNRGRYFLRGTVAIVSGAGIEWHCRGESNFRQNGKDPSVGFLEAVLMQGPELLAKLCAGRPERRDAEQELTDAFVQSGALPGSVRQQVRVGRQRFETDIGPFDWRRRIDLIVVRDDEHWVIEVKVRLDHEALGQALSYSVLYGDANPKVAVRPAIVCTQINGELLYVCSRHGVAVFEVGEDGVRVHEPTKLIVPE